MKKRSPIVEKSTKMSNLDIFWKQLRCIFPFLSAVLKFLHDQLLDVPVEVYYVQPSILHGAWVH